MKDVYQYDDEKLLQDLHNDLEGAFDALYDRYWEAVYDIAVKRLKRPGLAKDVTQDIFLHLWINRKELNISHLSAYLRVAVRNRTFKIFEKEKRYLSIEQIVGEHIHRQAERADDSVLDHEFLEAFRALVESLPRKRREIFRLYYNEGFSTEDIASRLELSRKTVQNQLGRAVSFLKTNLSLLFFLLIWL